MTLPLEAKRLIEGYVSKRISSYYDLSFNDQTYLVSTIIENLEQFDKGGILVDADDDLILPDLVARVIQTPNEFNKERLVAGLLSVFVNGKGAHPFFYHCIEECFEEEWAEQWPGESEYEEHFEHDAMERTRAAQWGQS
jgi:hypothetical protein